MQWSQAVAKSIDGMDIIEIDEMWHYIQKLQRNFWAKNKPLEAIRSRY